MSILYSTGPRLLLSRIRARKFLKYHSLGPASPCNTWQPNTGGGAHEGRPEAAGQSRAAPEVREALQVHLPAFVPHCRHDHRADFEAPSCERRRWRQRKQRLTSSALSRRRRRRSKQLAFQKPLMEVADWFSLNN